MNCFQCGEEIEEGDEAKVVGVGVQDLYDEFNNKVEDVLIYHRICENCKKQI